MARALRCDNCGAEIGVVLMDGAGMEGVDAKCFACAAVLEAEAITAAPTESETRDGD